MFKKYVSMLRREFKGYNLSSLGADAMAGLTVTAVALPLAIAFGVSCGADAAAGLVTAILAGLVIGFLSGASYQISGPTGAMSAVLVGIVLQFGKQGIFIVSFLAGILLLLAALFRVGKLVSMIPRSVITGFTSGIAVIIALGQIDNFFGVKSVGENAIEKLFSYGELGFSPNFASVGIGLLVMAIMIVFPKKWNARIPSSLVAIIIATAISAIFSLNVATVGSIPRTLFLEDRLDLTKVDWKAFGSYISPAISIAALGMIESLLCGASASRMKNEPFDADQELAPMPTCCPAARRTTSPCVTSAKSTPSTSSPSTMLTCAPTWASSTMSAALSWPVPATGCTQAWAQDLSGHYLTTLSTATLQAATPLCCHHTCFLTSAV